MNNHPKRTSAPQLVVISGNTYSHYHGRTAGPAFLAEYPISKSELEQFRVDPESLFEVCDHVA